MARCSCGNATCSCVITAGDGVMIVGNGSPTRPYEIAIDSAIQNLPSVLKVADTPTIDMVMVGTGTPSDPVSIYGNTKTKMTDLTDVSDPEGPQTGDVPIWQSTGHWEFRPLPSGPPTTVQTSTGITGDGSAGAPVALRTSGTWGTAPLDIFGTTNTGQLATFIDTAGQIRVPGDLIDAGTVNRLAADGLDKYPSGVSLLAISSAASTAGLWPGAGSVITTKRNSTQGTQYWMSLPSTASGIAPIIQYRTHDGVNWTAWYDLFRDTGWVNITPSSGTGTLQYRYRNGMVECRCALTGMTSVAASGNGTICPPGSIPAAYAPSVGTIYQMGNAAGNSTIQAVLNIDGGITFYNQYTAATTVARFTMVWLKETLP